MAVKPMMVLIFIILLVAVIAVWQGQRPVAIYAFSITLILASIWFGHHITDHLALQF
jgi:hypothetical protein